MSVDPVAFARDLIRCPSVTPAEGGALAYIEKVLQRAGFAAHRVIFEEAGADPVENLYARIGTAAPHLMLTGHTDVVPPGDEAKWSHPPFASELAGGILYGRGAVDMKGAIACKIAAALDYLGAHGGKPKGSLSFLITGDEEGIAVNGTVKLLKWAAERGEKFDHAILGEPTNPAKLGDMMKIGRRGSMTVDFTVRGIQGHVGYPERLDNPIHRLSALIEALVREPIDKGSTHFQPTSLQFTTVDVGNKATNIAPGAVRARFNTRFNDLWTSQKLLAHLKERIERASAAGGGNGTVEYTKLEGSGESFYPPPGGLSELVAGAVRDVAGVEPELSTTGGTSDARFISRYCPVLEFGLVGETMNKVDEKSAIEDLKTLSRVYETVLDRYFAA